MDQTMIIDGLDLKDRLLTYSVTQEISYGRVVTTLDKTEHTSIGKVRPEVEFTLTPGTDEENATLFRTLKKMMFDVTYTEDGVDVTKKMRLVSNLESVFLLTSIDGKRRYKIGAIRLRGL